MLDQGWNYYIDIPLTGPPGGDLYDYTIENITIPYAEAMTKPDFGDIRFGSATKQEEYPYHIVSKSDWVSATFAVMVPVIRGNSELQYVRCYAGNINATTTSDPDNTYLFFDDFAVYNDFSRWYSTELGVGDFTEWTINDSELISSQNGWIRARLGGSYDNVKLNYKVIAGGSGLSSRVDLANPNRVEYNSATLAYRTNEAGFIKTEEVTSLNQFSLTPYIEYAVEVNKEGADWILKINGNTVLTLTGWHDFGVEEVYVQAENTIQCLFKYLKLTTYTSTPPTLGEIPETWETEYILTLNLKGQILYVPPNIPELLGSDQFVVDIGVMRERPT